MYLQLSLTEHELKRLVLAHLQAQLGSVTLEESDVKIEVKSKQNYRAEWEDAAFRATVNKRTL